MVTLNKSRINHLSQFKSEAEMSLSSISDDFIKTLPHHPGVYSMLDKQGQVIYVGKAKDLKKRVSSYFSQRSGQSPKTQVMLSHLRSIRLNLTRNENEALLLENNLIKDLRPRYNILFKDDKSYPYIRFSERDQYPKLSYYRGRKKGLKNRYFGPYPTTSSVKKTLKLLQKLFLVRSCDDHVFANRSRPCLEYQIKRCSAPCVGYINPSDYQRSISHAVLFLEGKNEKLIKVLSQPMERAVAALDFESAARYRDQISALRQVQEKQYFNRSIKETDILACVSNGTQVCVEIMQIGQGLERGSQHYLAKAPVETGTGEILAAFLSQIYLKVGTTRAIPATILVNQKPEEHDYLESALSNKSGRRVTIRQPVRGESKRHLESALKNARLRLQQSTKKISYRQQMKHLRAWFKLKFSIQRIECFDVSHLYGDSTFASCVVCGREGLMRDQYRRFKLQGIKLGDDYAGLSQAVKRRYQRLINEQQPLPDLLLIDGGKGQVNSVKKTLAELGKPIPVIGIAKGPARKPGKESLIFNNKVHHLSLGGECPALPLIQLIRDEAHRFAITAHRLARSGKMKQSTLEDIDGIGAHRRKNLIRYFGGLQKIRQAGVEELAMVPNINRCLAERIYGHFNESL